MAGELRAWIAVEYFDLPYPLSIVIGVIATAFMALVVGQLVMQRMVELGAEVQTSSPAETTQWVLTDRKRWAQVIDRAGKIVGMVKGPKINGFTYKRRTNQRRRYGHRQKYHVLEITSIKKG